MTDFRRRVERLAERLPEDVPDGPDRATERRLAMFIIGCHCADDALLDCYDTADPAEFYDRVAGVIAHRYRNRNAAADARRMLDAHNAERGDRDAPDWGNATQAYRAILYEARGDRTVDAEWAELLRWATDQRDR